MSRYSRGKIYKLHSFENDLIYIGSTIQPLYKRLSGHKCKNNICSSKILFEESNKVMITLIKNYPCSDRSELEREERKYIYKMDCVNKHTTPYVSNNKEKEIDLIKKYKDEYEKQYEEQKKELNKIQDMRKKREQQLKIREIKKENYEKIIEIKRIGIIKYTKQCNIKNEEYKKQYNLYIKSEIGQFFRSFDIFD